RFIHHFLFFCLQQTLYSPLSFLLSPTDDLRLAALHDASFQSCVSNTYPGTGGLYPHNPSHKSNVRDPVRSSGRKHVTFKDLSAGKRGARPTPTTAAGMGTTTTTSIPTTNSLDSPRNGNSAGQSPRTQGDGSSNGASTNSPRYTQLPRSSVPQQNSCGSRDPLDSSKGGSISGQRDSPRNGRLGSSGNSLDSPRSSQPHQQESPRGQNMPIYANESSRSGAGVGSKDWSRPPMLIPSCDSPRQDSYYSGHAPRSTFKTSQELQTFHPPTRNSNAIKQSGSRDILPQQGTSSRNPREAGLGSRDARSHGPATTKDWRNDSFATTDDCDDQRSTTTTSGSYTIDNEDTYVGLHDLNHSPWKDVVV
ncbi:hypothetical protein BaRGS_00023189, partial [Batillaria attramentaria]